MCFAGVPRCNVSSLALTMMDRTHVDVEGSFACRADAQKMRRMPVVNLSAAGSAGGVSNDMDTLFMSCTTMEAVM